eukprot:43622_1
MSTKDSFQKSQPLPYQWTCSMPKPLICSEHSNYVIISTHCEDNNPGIFKYNLITNTMEMLHKYDNTTECSYHGQLIDGDSLFIFGGENDSFFAFDLNTKSIQTDNRTNTALNDVDCINCCYCAKTVYVSSSKINQFHITSTRGRYTTHFKYDCNNKTFTHIDVDLDIFDTLELKYP